VETTGSLYGQIDVPLSERGRAQSRELVQRLRPYRIDAVYASDLERSRWAAELIAADRGLGVEVRPTLRERMFGDWQGKSWDEIGAMSPDLLERYKRDFLSVRPPGGGETYRDVRDRVMPLIGEIVETAEEGHHFAIVAHAGVNRVILAEALGMPLANMFRIYLDPISLNIVDFHPNGRQVVRLVNGL
jgi:broad specificity phosphatase PhoE